MAILMDMPYLSHLMTLLFFLDMVGIEGKPYVMSNVT